MRLFCLEDDKRLKDYLEMSVPDNARTREVGQKASVADRDGQDRFAAMGRSLLAYLPSWSFQEWAPGLLLIVAVFVSFGPALHGGFVWDDEDYVVNDPLFSAKDPWRQIWFSLQAPSQYFPLTYSTFFLEWQAWGLNPAGYHLINILLHAANAFVLWRLLKRLEVPGAWLASAIFALHPVTVESVAWVSERKNVLMGFFFLLSARSWIEFIDERRGRSWGFYVLALVFYTLALFAKTTACTLPAALLLILWLKKMPIDWRRLAQITPFVAIGIGMGLISMQWENLHPAPHEKLLVIAPLERLLIASRALWFYAGKLFWPVNLMPNYPRWNIAPSNPVSYVWVAATAALAVLIWYLRRWTGRSLEVGVAFFAVTLSPMLGLFVFFTFIYSFVADHYQYLAGIGLISLAASGATIRLTRMRKSNPDLQWAVCAMILIPLAALTWRQCEIYESPKTFWEFTLKGNPNSALAHASLGLEEFRAGHLERALDHYQKALDMKPDFLNVNHNMGLCFFQLGKDDDAIVHFKREIVLQPKNVRAHQALGEALARKGEKAAAVAEFREALRLQPNSATIKAGLGVALLKNQNADEAVPYLQQALQANPGYEGGENILAMALAMKGSLKEAEVHFQNALDINPDDVEAGNDLAWLLATAADASLRDGAKSLALAQHVRELGGDNPLIFQTLAAAESENGNYPLALDAARHALELARQQAKTRLAADLESEIKSYEASTPARDWNSRTRYY